MATERTIINPINNVLYVEPNYIHSTEMYGARGLETYEMSPDLEDYSIFVNLEVELVGRTINALNNKFVLSYVSSGDKETINLMQGSKIPTSDGDYINSLTTNYTDLHLREMKSVGASPELFGISSIDIAYRNYTVPEVTIEFVDVRGAAVFGQRELYESERQEKAINENYSIDIQNTFFQCFFTFPSPKFNLLVKGFYGNPVSYELTCADFRARFDSETGNFSCTAKFVGYMFSFLNDVMMNGLIAAPYSDFIGAEYWSQQNFKLKGYDGGETDMPKLAKLLKELPDYINEANHISKNSPEVQEKRNIESVKKSVVEIKRIYTSYVKSIVNLLKKPADNDLILLITDSNNNILSSCGIVLIESDENISDPEEYEDYVNDGDGQMGVYDSLMNLIDEFNAKYSNRQLPKPIDMRTQTPSHRIFKNETDETKYIIDKNSTNDDIKQANEQFYEKFKNIVDKENTKQGDGVSRYSKYQFGYFYKDNGFYGTLKSVLESIAEEEKDINKKLEDSVKDALAERLGFYPTVENMTRIVMAHFETFAYMIFKTGLLIDAENPKRTLASLGIADNEDLSDVPLTDEEKEIPPFPKLTEIVEKDGIKNREESWVGVYGNKFREVDLVHGLLNGISEVADIENSGNNAGGAGSESSMRTKMKHPLSPLDFIATKTIYTEFDQNNPSDLLSLVAMRAIQIISSSNYSDWNSKCDALGTAEAENLLATEKLSNDLKEKLKNLSSDTVVSMLKGNNVDNLKPASGVWPWKKATDDTGIISSDGDLNVCKVTSNNGKTVFTVPFQALGWNKIKQEVFNTKSAFSDDYFNVAESDYYNAKKNNLFNLDTNITRIKTIAERQMVDVDGIDFYRDKILNEATYKSKVYDDYLTGDADDIIANYIEGAENLMPSEKSCMLPCTSKYLEKLGLFAGGYDMDCFHNENPGDGGKSFFGLFGNGWSDINGNEVKRAGGDGYKEFLEDTNTSKHTITEFPGINSRFEPYVKLDNAKNLVSLFGEELYYMQDNDNVKAFMFLCSLGGIYKYEKIIEDEICNKSKTISIIPLAGVIYAGGLVWARNNTDKFKHCKPFVDGGAFSSANTNTNCYNILKNNLNNGVLSSLKGAFEYFVKSGVKGNSRIKSFNSFRKNLELTLVRGDITYEQFFNNLGEIEENVPLGINTNWYKTGIFEDRGYTDLLKFFIGELGENFLKNYITIDEDLGGDTGNYTVGFRLGNRDGSPGVVDAVNFGLAPCTFMKNTKFFYKDSPSKINIDEDNLKTFFDSFLSKIGEGAEETVTDNSISQADATKTSEDIKIGVYRYCKLLYDKWIGGTKEDEFNKMWTVHSLFDESKEDKYFHFIDSYYNKIGQYILINVGDFCEQVKSCYQSDQYSLLSFLSSVYAKNKFNLLCVQNFMDMQELENMKKMFDCVPYTSGWNVRKHPNFIVQYPYEPSSHLDYDDSYTNDGFMINEPQSSKNKWPEALKSRLADADDDYKIPAFGVSYGKMYQSYFKDIDVSMDNPKVTEQSIKAQFAIASLNSPSGNTNDRSNGYTLGQDLFSIYSNNSYTCNVTMMGCAWVQPMMYFVLNNVPMFRGTYMIITVSHRIEQGNMITKFTGVRMANVNTRVARDCTVRPLNDGNDSMGDSENENNYEEAATTDNDCPYKLFPIVNTSGGDYGEPNYSSLLTGTVGNAKGNKLGSPWNSRNLLDSLTAAVCAESDGTETGIIMVTTTMYNRVRADGGSFKNVLSGAYSVWSDGGANRKFNSHPSNWTDVKICVNSVFTNGACSTFVGKEFVTPDWNLDRNSNNDLYHLKPKTRYTLSSEQVSTMWYYGFKGEWDHTYVSRTTDKKPDNQIRHKENKLLAVLGTHTPQAVCMDPNMSKKLKITKPAAIINNGDNHVKELANGFLEAINKTSQSSSVKVNIGVDNSKSKDNILYLQSPGNKDFGKVFDIIINGYSNNVSEVKWVVPKGGNQSAPPRYLITTVVESCSSTKIIVVSEENIDNNVTDLSFDKDSGMNQDFCKAIYKKYKNNRDKLTSDLVPNSKNIDELFAMYEEKVKDCNTYVNGEGSTPSSQVTTTDWNVDAFVQNLHYWQKEVCNKHPDRALPSAKARSRGGQGGCSRCTGAINRALEDTGCGKKFWRTYPWEVYQAMNGSAEFGAPAMKGSGKPSNVHFVFPQQPQKGDICVMWCNYNTDTSKNHFHTCAFDGSKWISDFVQNNCNVYTNSSVVYDNIQWYVFRHK